MTGVQTCALPISIDEGTKELTDKDVSDLREKDGVSVCNQLALMSSSLTCGYRRYDGVKCINHNYRYHSLNAVKAHELLHFTNFRLEMNVYGLPEFKAAIADIKIPLNEFKDEATAAAQILKHPKYLKAIEVLDIYAEKQNRRAFDHTNVPGASTFSGIMKSSVDEMVQKVVDARRNLSCPPAPPEQFSAW